jgi:hypothetical protein
MRSLAVLLCLRTDGDISGEVALEFHVDEDLAGAGLVASILNGIDQFHHVRIWAFYNCFEGANNMMKP